MQSDIVNDALANIHNAEKSGKYEVVVRPVSRLLENILSIMQNSGYIADFEKVVDGRGDSLRVELSGSINHCGIIKPRFSVRRADYEKWEARYLPAQDFGLLILTTNQGVMHHYAAKEARIGGRLLAYVY